MKHPERAASLQTGALLLGGTATCGDDNSHVEDVSPELDEGSDEDGLVEEGEDSE